MKKIRSTYGPYIKNKEFMLSFLFSLLALAFSLLINFYASMYATESASGSVTDIILSNIKVYDVDGIFIYGPVILWAFTTFILLAEPRNIPFTLKSVALFVVIRSLFVSLTHLGPFPSHISIPYHNLISDFSTGNDLFFSGHTGLPFLLALIFWDNKYLRALFIGSSVLFGIVVLLGHLHYSIDVLSAFFITYTIYHIAETIFAKDKKLFTNGLE